MFPARSLTRAAPRAARSARGSRISQRRAQSSATPSTSNAAGSGSSHIASGVAGGIAGASLLYGIYTMTPAGQTAKQVNKVAKEADKKYQALATKLKEKTPSADEAVDSIKQVCYSYVGWIPGGRQYVDTAFRDLDSVRESNKDEANALINETYKRFQDIVKAGLSMEALSKAYDALTDLGQKLASLAGNSVDKIIDNHPELKEKLGGPIDQLKQMGDQYGPEAKKMVDETWQQVKEITSSGFSADTADKVRKLVEEKSQQLKKFGDQAWQKGLEQAQPLLDKNPKVKELIKKNEGALKQGNATELFKQVKSTIESGDSGKLEEYVKKAVDKAKSSGSSMLSGGSAPLAALGSYFGASNGKVQQNIQLLTEVVEKHADQGKDLLKETKDDLTKVLEEKAIKAQKIVDSARKEKAAKE
ncbi:hypothetical protein B0T22DRAFT_472846 [Podospora appendiculata]|uniref:Uncharacterized protein n=1 Tax=Podospora appendiculata TaxID=314037 RepID=A0AAE0WZW2_9PEZI|nr:hypothetical protein B0T22DRAFT_472846 [Podospora appendiculata]